MKTINRGLVFLFACSVVGTPFATTFAQGLLTPPGAPAPTMKTLAQMEPRIAITNTTSAVTISQAGSYYLTGNLTVSSGNAISIAASGVTLDLNGFTISSTAASATGSAILFTALNLRDFNILNGHIASGVTNNGSGVFSGSGFAYGINYSTVSPVSVLIANVSISGCLTSGILLGTISDTTVVEGCTVRTAGVYGISAGVVKNCSAADCGSYAFFCSQAIDCRGAGGGNGGGVNAVVAQNCYGTANGSGTGIAAVNAQNCYGNANGSGYAINCSTALNCTGASFGSGDGIKATLIQNCSAGSSSGSAFRVNIDGTITGCSASGGATGITAGSRAVIKDCTFNFCDTNGIVAGSDSRISGCIVVSIGTGTNGIGIFAGNNSTIEDCTVNNNQADGIRVASNCTVLNNHASGNGVGVVAAGIHATGTGNRIEGNHARSNTGYGIKSDGGVGADVVIRNTSGGNSVGSYTPATGATFGPIQTIATFTNALGNVVF